MRRIVIGLATTALFISACSSSDTSSADTANNAATTAFEAPVAEPSETVSKEEEAGQSATEEAGAAKAAAGEVPDPCAVLTAAEIQSIIGVDVGSGEGGSVDPSRRKVCTFEGLTLGVEVAEDFQSSIEYAKESGFEYDEVPGLGEQAYIAVIGGSKIKVVSVVAVDGDYMVDLSGSMTEDQAKRLTSTVLDALG